MTPSFTESGEAHADALRLAGYPPPPRWPNRLTRTEIKVPEGMTLAPVWVAALRMDLFETSVVLHTYIADGMPGKLGPCVTAWFGETYYCWHPCLTTERAEHLASMAPQW